jgi:phosphatidylglycerol---prolipoprotein diacylglyceryl transferase
MNTAFYITLDPVIFQLGSVPVSWYGLMILLATVTVVLWSYLQNRKRHLFNNEVILTAIIVGLPSAIIFSKLLHVIDNLDFYRMNPGLILSGDGLAIWGAVLGATLGIWIYSLLSRQFRFAILGDMIAPGVILAQAIGRVGCTINGCCSGFETHSPLAVIYTSTPYAPLGIPVLPVPVFEIIFNLIVFGLLLSLRSKLKPPGSLFLLYLALYAAWRFGSDFMRTGTPFLFNLHEAQVIGLLVLLITVPWLIIRLKKNRIVEESAQV